MRLTGNPPLVVILGPTAVGKTELAVQLAQAVGGEIVSADSRQVYRYMDIGTAKPTAEQRTQASHHLLDIVKPDENLSLAVYQEMAYQVIDQVHQREKVPLLVGGTGQYITAVTEGWSIPRVAPNPTLRDELEGFAAEHGKERLYDRLRELDPAAAAKIHPNNVRRVVRALEVCIEVGQPISELQRKKPPPYRILQYGLTLERDKLYARANLRVDQMMQMGFLEEVCALLEMGYARSLPSMSGLGYRELAAHILDGISLAEAIEATKIATHAFIRRQHTWFRGHDHGILWQNIDSAESAAAITAHCIEWLNSSD